MNLLLSLLVAAATLNLIPHNLVKTEVPVSFLSVNEDSGSTFLDFGRDAFAQIKLTLDADYDQTVKVHLGEAMDDFKFDEGTLSALPYDRYGRKSFHVCRTPYGSVRYCCYDLPVRKGLHTYSIAFRPDPRNTRTRPVNSGAVPILMPESIGEVYPFRYCEVEGLKGRVAREKTVQIAVHYPFNRQASDFESSDKALNKVWELCKYSIEATSFCGYYVDGDRERIPYEADALINMLAHYGVDSEYAMGRRSAAYLMENPTWPTEWHLEMVLVAWYDYIYTGDTSFISKYYDVLHAKTLLAIREKNGLISTCTGKMTPEVKKSLNYRGSEPIKDIVDWPRSGSFGIGKKEAGEADGYVMTDYNTVVNALHYECLLLMSRMASAIGKRSDAKMYKTEATSFLKTFNMLLFDSGKSIYRDGLDTDHCSLHANMFPLLFGMVPNGHEKAVLDFVKSRGMACSVYGSQFLLDALYEAGEADYALSLMNATSSRSWINMLRSGSTITMEAWDKVYKSNLDWNHAWGAAPADIIPRRLVGVRPAAPGFTRMTVSPKPGSLEWFKALVPTPEGGVSCSYARKNDGSRILELIIPEGIKSTEIMLDCAPNATATVMSADGRSGKVTVKSSKASAVVSPGKWTMTVL